MLIVLSNVAVTFLFRRSSELRTRIGLIRVPLWVVVRCIVVFRVLRSPAASGALTRLLPSMFAGVGDLIVLGWLTLPCGRACGFGDVSG